MPSTATSQRPPAIFAAVLLASGLLFLPTLGADFVWDDRPLVLANANIRTLGGLWHAVGGDFFQWSEGAESYGYWRPVVTLSFAAQRALHGPSAVGFHAANLALHLMVAALGWRLARRQGLSPAASTAAVVLFAVMPSHVEAVSWISGRTDLLASLFFLLALDADAAPGNRRVAATAVFFALALASKEFAVAAPLAALLLHRHRWTWSRIGAFAAPLLVWGLVRSQLVAIRPSHGAPDTVLQWAMTVPAALEIYLGGLLGWHPPLAYRTLPPVEDWARPEFWTGLALLAGATALGLWHRRAGRVLAVGLLVLLPALNVVRVAAPVDMGFPVSDRFGYLPSLFWAVGGTLAIAPLLTTRPRGAIATAAMAPLVAALAVMTWRAQGAWQDDVALFTDCAEQNPGRPLVEAMLVEAHRREGNLHEAKRIGEQISRRHLDAGEDLPGALRLSLLAAAAEQAEPVVAQALWRRHIAAVPTPNAIDWFNLGIAEDRAGDLVRAHAAFEKSTALQGDFLPAWVGLGLVSWKARDKAGARAALVAGRRVDPDFAGLHDLEALLSRPENP